MVHWSQVPRKSNPILMIWTLHCNRDPARDIIKWKAWLCVGGHRQIYGNTYWMTSAPVISWMTIRCVFILGLLMGWYMQSIDFIMGYSQAKVKMNIFMKLPTSTTLPNADPNKCLLKLQQNLYGLKNGQVTWHEHMKAGLKECGFTQ